MKSDNAIILDLETRSYVDLPKSNAWIYGKHPSTDIITMAFKKLDLCPVYDWVPGKEILFRDVPSSDTKIVAHNALFEYSLFYHVLVPRYGFPTWTLEPERWICTQGLAYSAGLPGSLEEAAKFLNLKNQKQGIGKSLITKYSLPLRDKKTKEPIGFREFEPGDFELMQEYCRADVLATEELYKIVHPLPNTELERRLWVLDFKQNIKGIPVDRVTMSKVQKIIDIKTKEAEKEMKEIGVNVRSTKQMPEHFKKYGYDLPNLQVDTIDKFENIVKEPELKRLLTLRKFLGKASVKKYIALANRTDEENILRLLVKYHKAHTGRWGGVGFQPHNLPRMGASEKVIEEAIIKIERPDIDYTDLIKYAKTIIPGLIKAAKKFLFIKGDFAAIEARVVAYLAGQQNLVDMFARGEPIYERMGSLIFDIPVGKIGKKDLARMVGKQTTLGGGFGMGWVKFLATCEKFGIIIKPQVAQKAINTFRSQYPQIVKLWYSLQNAFISIWRGEKKTIQVGYLIITGSKNCIRIILPSQRSLYYHRVHFKDNQLSFYSGEKKTRIDIWGGLITENVVQATARDIIAYCMLGLDEVKLNPILHVHDEIICHVHEDGEQRALNIFNDIMNQAPPWLPGFPLLTESEVSRRYFK